MDRFSLLRLLLLGCLGNQDSSSTYGALQGAEDVGVVGAAQQFVAQDGVLPDAFQFVKPEVDKQHADVVQEAACGELAEALRG